jgi:hypothetical protein
MLHRFINQVLEFASNLVMKVVHHISSISVLASKSPKSFDELDATGHEEIENGYCLSKLVAEHLIIRARQQGLDAKIYRYCFGTCINAFYVSSVKQAVEVLCEYCFAMQIGLCNRFFNHRGKQYRRCI